MTNVLTKKEIVKKLAELKTISLVAAAKEWDQFCDFIAKEVTAGNGIKIKGVGTIRRVDRAAHDARVPNSETITHVPARFSFKLKSKRFNA